jgi:hypothetical protein
MPAEMGRMQSFVADLLTQQGALVDPIEPEGLEVLAPPSVQQALGVNELSRLGFGATLPVRSASALRATGSTGSDDRSASMVVIRGLC